MEVMKLLVQLGTAVEAAAAEKAALKEKIDEADQGVSQMLGELQKAAATHGHIKFVKLQTLANTLT
jgi:hypothetical protein